MASAPITPRTQQITTTSPAELRAANASFSQSLARDIETLTYQVNQLLRQVAELTAKVDS